MWSCWPWQVRHSKVPKIRAVSLYTNLQGLASVFARFAPVFGVFVAKLLAEKAFSPLLPAGAIWTVSFWSKLPLANKPARFCILLAFHVGKACNCAVCVVEKVPSCKRQTPLVLQRPLQGKICSKLRHSTENVQIPHCCLLVQSGPFVQRKNCVLFAKLPIDKQNDILYNKTYNKKATFCAMHKQKNSDVLSQRRKNENKTFLGAFATGLFATFLGGMC